MNGGWLALLLVFVVFAGCVDEETPPPQEEPPAVDLVPQLVQSGGRSVRANAVFSDGAAPADAGWDWGDGTSSRGAQTTHAYARDGAYLVELTAVHEETGVHRWNRTVFFGQPPANPDPVDPDPGDPSPSPQPAPREPPTQPEPDAPVAPTGHIPHVIVGVGDSGFNVYHDVYSRPELQEHPCTYIEDYPCHIPALRLTLDEPDFHTALAADLAIWQSIRPGDGFWIPGTNIVYAGCYQPYEGSNAASTNPTGGADLCILDDTSMHGTGTSSSVLSENPDALLAVAEGNSGSERFLLESGVPIDVQSHSWGPPAPIPLPESSDPRIFVVASGNEGAFPKVLDGDGLTTDRWLVGAADAGSRTEPGYSGWKTMDFVSEYCRPTAQTQSTTETRAQYCGTSFSAPTFAGALSRIILELRKQSGWSGSMVGDEFDPIWGFTEMDLRRAINHTATYTPPDKWNDGGDLVPLVAPWYQWGWGYFDGQLVDAAKACLVSSQCPERPLETVLYMEALWAVRSASPLD